MTGFAKRLPVVLIPKAALVATMRDDMVNDCGSDNHVFILTISTKRVLIQKRQARLIPSIVIPAFVRGWSFVFGALTLDWLGIGFGLMRGAFAIGGCFGIAAGMTA